MIKTDELEQYFQRFPDVPREVIVKEDILRLGLKFSSAALTATEGCRHKSYRLFTYDKVKHEALAAGEPQKIPEDVQIRGGVYQLRRIILSVRLSIDSPYTVDVIDGKVVVTANGQILGEVTYPPRPDYYAKSFPDGTPYSEVGPLTTGGTCAFFTVFRVCQYWGAKEECKFCDINQNLRQAKKYGKAYAEDSAYKNIDQVAEVAAAIFHTGEAQAGIRPVVYTITGGAITSTVAGKKENDFYLAYVRAIKSRIGGRWPCVLQTVAKDKATYKEYRQNGVDIVHPNIEVWDKDLFRVICPGKDHYIGRDEWVKRVIDAVDVFGEGNVAPNFIPGVEMAKPYGFQDIDSALKSNVAGMEYLMSRGVLVRFNQWNISPVSGLAGNLPPPLDYFIRLDQAWCEIWTKYGLPPITGLGQMGPGIATWFNSAVLDMDLTPYGSRV